jgi:hypothetical protein
MAMMRKWILVILGLALVGCASYTDATQEIRYSFISRDYRQALAKLESTSLMQEGRNRLLYYLEKATLLDRLGERNQSRNNLIEADRLADKLYTVSVTRTAASFVVNDAAADYAGEDYERVAIHTMLALSFIDDGDLPSALTEARKINSKLYEINHAYEGSPNQYGEDAFARFLSGLIYEADGKFDDAIIDYRKAIELYSGPYRKFYNGPVPRALIQALSRVAQEKGRSSVLNDLKRDFPDVLPERDDGDFGYVAIIHEIGTIALKRNEDFVLPIGRQIVRFSFPVIRKDTYRRNYGFTGVHVDGSGDFDSANVQDFDAIASQTLNDRRTRMIVKSGARLLAKGQLTEYAYDHFGPLGGIAANIYSAVSETGDTRSWTTLPESINITRMRLSPGKHKVRIESGGRVVDLKTVDVQRGKLIILRG